jgi:hypothetical protein
MGKVIDRSSATPLPDVRVNLSGIDSFTDNDGLFTFRVDQLGWHTLKIRNIMYRPYSKKIEVGPGENSHIIQMDRVLPNKVYQY